MSKISPLLDRLEKIAKTDIRYFISGNFWLTFSRATSILSGFILTTALANLLARSTYGFLDYAMALSSTLSAFSLIGLGTAITNGVARGDDGVLRESFIKSVKWGLAGTVIAFGMAIFYFLHHDIQTGSALLMIAVSGPVMATGNYKSFLVGKKDFKALSLYSIPRTYIPLIAMVVTAAIDPSPLAIVAAYFASNMFASALVYFDVIRRYKVPRKAKDLQGIMHFAKHTTIIGFLSQISSQLDQLLVWHFMGADSVAIYSLATSPVEELKNIPANIFNMAIPKYAARRDEDLRHVVWQKMKQLFIIVAVVAFIYIVAAPFVFTVLFPKYIVSIAYTRIYALVLLFQPQGFVDAMLIAKENIPLRRTLTIVNQLIKLVLLTVGIAYFGIWGGIGALMASEAVNLVTFSAALARVK
ncbi:MAG: oligosaccharide flippase family protein [Patescibacteria group bacterium]|nr:oligosaccharide flippase family protein [Patescibacteria group bacterium]MDE2116376.1 oligosaccharide flippase family protein [Patescibacteria group bacterium]